MAGSGLLATLLWDSPLLTPLKWITVLVHEMWHGGASMLAGAHLDRIVLHASESGETFVTGLTSATGFAIAVSSGYLGSTATGALLLNRGLSGRFERLTLFIFASVLFYMSFLFTEPGSLAYFTGMGWAALLILMAPLRTTARYTLIIIGTLFVWYCLYDMFDFARDIRKTDAGILAAYLEKTGRVSGGSETWICFIWLTSMLVLLFFILKPVLRKAPSPPAPVPVFEPNPQFPGAITPEVQEWFLMNGFDPEGRPLDPAGMELRETGPAGNEGNTIHSP